MRSRIRASRRFAAAACLPLLFAAGPAAAAEKAAVFDPELYDTSGEGAREEQQKRLGMVGERLRAALRDSGRDEVVDTAPVRARRADDAAVRTPERIPARLMPAVDAVEAAGT